MLTSCEAEPESPTAARSPSQPEQAAVRTEDHVAAGRQYVPMYSHIYARDGAALDLAVTVSVRNVSVEHPMTLESVRYYDTAGKLLEEFVKTPSSLAPLQTVEFFVPTSDTRGGSGANLVVTWSAANPIVPPIVEAIMVQSGKTNRAFAFSTRGIEIDGEATLPNVQAPPAPRPPEEAADVSPDEAR